MLQTDRRTTFGGNCALCTTLRDLLTDARLPSADFGALVYITYSFVFLMSLRIKQLTIRNDYYYYIGLSKRNVLHS